MPPAGRASTIFAGAVPAPLWADFLWAQPGCAADSLKHSRPVALADLLQSSWAGAAENCRCCKRESGFCTERWSGSPAAQHSSRNTGTAQQHTRGGVLHSLDLGTVAGHLILEQGPHKVDPLTASQHQGLFDQHHWHSSPGQEREPQATLGLQQVEAWQSEELLRISPRAHQHEQMSCQVWWPTWLHSSFWLYLSEHCICGRQTSPFHSGMLRKLHSLHPLIRLPKRCPTCTVQVRDLARHRTGRGVFNFLEKFSRF